MRDDVHAALDLRFDERDLRGGFGGRRSDELELAAERLAGVFEAAGDRVEVGVAGVLADIDDLERILGDGGGGREGQAEREPGEQSFLEHFISSCVCRFDPAD